MVEGDVHARRRTEGPGKPGGQRPRLFAAGEAQSPWHPCQARLSPYRRGDALCGGPPATNLRDDGRGTRPYARKRPRRAYRQPSRPAVHPKLARVGTRKTDKTRGLMAARTGLSVHLRVMSPTTTGLLHTASPWAHASRDNADSRFSCGGRTRRRGEVGCNPLVAARKWVARTRSDP